MLIRDATRSDFGRINEIYNWTLVDNHVSFDTEPFDLESRSAWWDDRHPDLTCLVGEDDGTVVGVTYSTFYRPKLGYRSTMETTIVLDDACRGKGFGTVLLGALLDRLTEQGVHLAVAIVALPNDASVSLHRKLGYSEVGILHEVGTKLGQYWDTMLLERRCGSDPSLRGST